MRPKVLTAAAILAAFALPISRAQAPVGKSVSPKFEVATLRPSQPGQPNGIIRPAPGGERYVATNVPLRLIIQVAYRVKTDQIAGGPDWMQNESWDMNAKAERPSSVEDLHLMLQNLLADRFKLKFHHETKELPVYALSVDKNGSKLQPHEAQSAGDPWIDQAIEQVVHMTMTAKFVPMDYFVWRLGMLLDRPVIDRTALQGGYDFVLKFTRDLPRGLSEGALINGSPIDTSGPNIFEAVRQQLGLKLEAQKGPVEIMIVDHAEKPVEN